MLMLYNKISSVKLEREVNPAEYDYANHHIVFSLPT
jgi:hypothetical protein